MPHSPHHMLLNMLFLGYLLVWASCGTFRPLARVRHVCVNVTSLNGFTRGCRRSSVVIEEVSAAEVNLLRADAALIGVPLGKIALPLMDRDTTSEPAFSLIRRGVASGTRSRIPCILTCPGTEFFSSQPQNQRSAQPRWQSRQAVAACRAFAA